ncbi:MAG TPA: TonB-dependent receptor, partial [Burkholderiaceae bacterium]|nr:TonB-dependent receptor [Burkholderiaceae bacterium]
MIALGITLALGFSGTWTTAAAAPPAAETSTAIPPMPLKQALHRFVQDQHLQIVYVTRVADDVHTRGARAGLSQKEALGALLRGTGLTFRYIDAKTIAISRAAEPPDTDPPSDPQRGQPDRQEQQAPTNLRTVVVTGTRAANRTAVQSLSPIDVLSSQDLRATGAPDLTSALRTLLPSINFAQPSDVDGNEAIQSVQLRGLAPNQVLVLINGKRQHSTSIVNVDRKTYSSGSEGFDFNSIPMNAIDHIEVLRDGAAAQYGSDAIAGVVNIILKGGARHGTIGVTHGQYFAGDGSTWQARADGGVPLGSKGWIHLSVNYEHKEATNRAGPDFRYPGDPTYGTVTFHYGQPKRQRKQAGINLQYSFSPHAQLYGYVLYSKRHPTSNGYFRSLSQYANHPAAVALYPRGYLPVEERDIQDDTETLGLRGTILDGWHYDISVNGGGNHVKSHVRHSFNYALGAASPTRFYTGTTAIRDKIVNADFTRSFAPGWLNNPLTVSWGVAYRDQTYTTRSGERASYVGSGSQ